MSLIRIYQDTDTGAVARTTSAGNMISILDRVLVDGQNSGSCTISRSGSVATIARTSHGFVVRQVVQIAGADQAEYNGLFRVASVPDANSFTVTVAGAPATPATGTITCKQASAGWVKAYSGTNKAAYQMPSAEHAGQMLFRAWNDATMTGSEGLRMRGYEAMSDVDTGTNPFPTVAQVAGNGIASACLGAGTAATTYRIFTNGKVVIIVLAVTNAGSSRTYSNPAVFGAFAPKGSADAYCVGVWGGVGLDAERFSTFASATNPPNMYLARSHTSAAGAVQCGRVVDSGLLSSSGTVAIGSAGLAAPNATDGAYYVSAVRLITAGLTLRGVAPGVHCPMHAMTSVVSDGAIMPGAGPYAGREFMACNITGSGQLWVDITGPWDGLG